MNKLIVLLLGMTLFCMSIIAQETYLLSGHVFDENKLPLPGATVMLLPEKNGTVTNAQGDFSINNLPKGKYVLEISFVGYKTLRDSVSISKNIVVKYRLQASLLTLQEVVVTDHAAETLKRETSLNIEVVNTEYLKQNSGGSLMQSLNRLPGISTIDIGSGQSKPVIRGLGFNRVVVVENGVKHEGQQWGADHGLEIDQYAAENIEVVKGPASLMYGSDAIGGVIDINQSAIPTDGSLKANLDLMGKSNNNLFGSSLAVYGRKKWFFANARLTYIDYGDYKVPTDSIDIYSYKAALHKNKLRNTAGNEKNLHLQVGLVKKYFTSKFFVSTVNSESGFFANAHGLEPRNVDVELHDKSDRDIQFPYQEVSHLKLINKSLWHKNAVKLETDFGFQRNNRNEWSEYVSHGYMPAIFPDTLPFSAELERAFDKYIYSANVKGSYTLSEKTLFTVGLNSDYQDNRIDGRGFIIPTYRQTSIGGFLYAKQHLSEISLLQAGFRYDYGNLQTQEYNDWFMSPIVNNGDTIWQYLNRAINLNRDFSNTSWSIGYNFNPEQWSLKVNVGKSFRMPIAKELAANGVNYHHFSYEVGNADLSPEISYQLDLGLEYNSMKFAIGTTPFLNYFSNYIYLNPSSEHDRLYGNGNQVFYYNQCEVFRFGAELHAHYQIIKPLQIGIIGEYVYSEQLSGEKKGRTLPFSPPASAILNIKYQKQKIKYFENVYVSIDYKLTAPQNNIVPPEETTAGYQLINLSLGGDVKLKKQSVNISFQIQNLFNTKYFNHTNYYRLINVPDPGRNFILNISIPISIKKIKSNTV
ncbi:MAG: TonB-dependent receptor [Bacteroidales bacterium]|nr:TonB-dependent receptor [Bacteroidales bacterium]